jgi:ferredoxin
MVTPLTSRLLFHGPTGLSVHMCRPGDSALDALKRGGGSLPVGCRRGGCGVCRIKLVNGTVDRRKMSRAHVSEADEAQGFALACCVYPTSDIEVEPAGKEIIELSFAGSAPRGR